MSRPPLLLAALALAMGACGPRYDSAFSYHFLDNQETHLAAILAELPAPSPDDAPENALGAPIAVASTHVEAGGARQLIAWQVTDGQQLWAVDADVATQPEILGDVVLYSSRERLFALDLRGGRELWHHDLPDLAYVGASRDGATIYWAATVGALGGARRVGHVVAMDARTGAERWRHEVQGVFGQPAASGGVVFVPWERQNIAVLSGATGVELARLRSTDDVIAWAFEHPTGIYYGGQGIYRLSARSHAGVREESTYLRPPLGDLPRQPDSIWPDGFVPKPGTRSARGRIRVYFNPAPAPDAETIALEGDTYYFVYYRYVFAYSLDGVLRWTRVLEQDVANAEAMPHGLLTFGEQGRMHLLDRDSGNDRWTQDTGTQIASVALDAAGFDPGGSAGDSRTLRESLNELVLDPDNRLVAARAYAIQQLAQIDDAEITRDLLDLYQQRAMPGALRAAIREALTRRRSGQQYLMEALTRRFDYLEETQAPPLEAIVPALLAMQHAEAVPQLINHLMDHETPAAVLPELVDAIVRLGGAEAVPALRRFLTLYQQDSLFAGPVADQAPEEEGAEPVRARAEARALALAARGIFEHGGPEGRELLAGMRTETARLHAPIREYISGLYEGEASAASEAEAAEEAARLAALAEAAQEAEAALPVRLTTEQINATFHENADALRDCIAGELERNERLSQVRLVFILSSDGRASDLRVTPRSEELDACLQGRVTAIQFPRFRQRRMRGSFVVSIQGSGGEEGAAEDTHPALASAAPEGAPWYWYERERARLRDGEGAGATAAWWATSAWWTERAAPVAAAADATSAPETVECPPGMSADACRRRQVAAQAASSGASGSSGSPEAGPGTSDGGEAHAAAGGGQSGAGAATDTGSEEGQGDESGSGAEEGSGGTPWWAAAASEDTEDDEEGEGDD